MSSYSSQVLTVGNTAVSFDTKKLSPQGRNIPLHAVVMVEGASIRFKTVGIPTPIEGFIGNVGVIITLMESEHDIEHFQAIALNPADQATLYAEFFNR